jgi:hypothetical protein
MASFNSAKYKQPLQARIPARQEDIPAARIFIPAIATFLDRKTNTRQPVADWENGGKLAGILQYGHPIFMHHASEVRPAQLSKTNQMFEKTMLDFSERDFILADGDSVLVAAAAIIAARRTGGKVQMLKRLGDQFTVYTVDSPVPEPE